MPSPDRRFAEVCTGGFPFGVPEQRKDVDDEAAYRVDSAAVDIQQNVFIFKSIKVYHKGFLGAGILVVVSHS
jgi:hypothetical protein